VVPEVFGEYLLVDTLGGASMTEVFLAVKLGDASGRTLVVKRPRLGEHAAGPAAEALRREAEVLRTDGLRGVPRIEADGVIAGLPFLAVEHLRGVSLDRILHEGPLSEDEALVVGRDLARALAALHETDWVHGDVAPANVLVDDAGEIVLLDLGLARHTGEAREAPAGKAGYVAPDVARAKPAQTADDVYAWGIVVSECVLGRRLFDESDLAEASVRSSAVPEKLAALPFVSKALARKAEDRPSAEAIAAGIAVEAGARATLAARVTDKPAPPSSTTAKRPSAKALRAEIVDARSQAPTTIDKRPPATRSNPLGRSIFAVVVLAIVGAFAIGLFLGRRAPHPHADATITLPMLPTRTEVLLDGKSMLVPEPGRGVPLEPGRHTLSLKLAKRETREYEFVAEPGDHVVVVSVSAAKGSP